ncbi:MAG: hypothetical protein U0359_05025 [Byssovorax sp.]
MKRSPRRALSPAGGIAKEVSMTESQSLCPPTSPTDGPRYVRRGWVGIFAMCLLITAGCDQRRRSSDDPDLNEPDYMEPSQQEDVRPVSRASRLSCAIGDPGEGSEAPVLLGLAALIAAGRSRTKRRSS